MRAESPHYDLAVVGAGIVGLSCARAAALRGLRVVVVDRDAQANGASVRNFGFITVTGQERGLTWQRARRSCAIWRQVAADTGIPILQQGLWLTARRPEAVPLLEAFLNTEMGEGCELLTREAAKAACADLPADHVQAVLRSSQEVRVESRQAIPLLAGWLERHLGVDFMRQTSVLGVELPQLHTSRGNIRAEAVAVCPGDDLVSLYPERIAAYRVTRCRLQMLRLASPGFELPGVIMSDLGLLRYLGYSDLPESAALRKRLHGEQAAYFEHGIHLIAAQGADGSLIVGDSHHYETTPAPFASEEIDRLILAEYSAALGMLAPAVLERWIGTYSSAPDRTMFIDAPESKVRIAMVTSGSGASTGFAIGEEVVADLFDGQVNDEGAN